MAVRVAAECYAGRLRMVVWVCACSPDGNRLAEKPAALVGAWVISILHFQRRIAGSAVGY